MYNIIYNAKNQKCVAKLEKEKWNVDTTQIELMADEAIEEYTKILNKLENKE